MRKKSKKTLKKIADFDMKIRFPSSEMTKKPKNGSLNRDLLNFFLYILKKISTQMRCHTDEKVPLVFKIELAFLNHFFPKTMGKSGQALF